MQAFLVNLLRHRDTTVIGPYFAEHPCSPAKLLREVKKLANINPIKEVVTNADFEWVVAVATVFATLQPIPRTQVPARIALAEPFDVATFLQHLRPYCQRPRRQAVLALVVAPEQHPLDASQTRH